MNVCSVASLNLRFILIFFLYINLYSYLIPFIKFYYNMIQTILYECKFESEK